MNSIGWNCCSSRSAERDVLLAAQRVAAPATMLLDIKGIGPEFAAILWSEGLFRYFDNRRRPIAWRGSFPSTINLTFGRRAKRLHRTNRRSLAIVPFAAAAYAVGHRLPVELDVVAPRIRRRRSGARRSYSYLASDRSR